MNDFERINQPRVEKILKMINVIETSAKSNRTSEEDVAQLLAPIKHALSGHSAAPARPAPTEGSKWGWSTIREIAESAPLKDFPVAIAVYQNRIDELI